MQSERARVRIYVRKHRIHIIINLMFCSICWNFLLLAWKWDAENVGAGDRGMREWERARARETWKRVRIWFQRSFEWKRAASAPLYPEAVMHNWSCLVVQKNLAEISTEKIESGTFRYCNNLCIAVKFYNIVVWQNKILSNIIKNQVWSIFLKRRFLMRMCPNFTQRRFGINFPTYANPIICLIVTN